jgi:hypothetical protein
MLIMAVVVGVCLAICHFLSFKCEPGGDNHFRVKARNVLFILADDLGNELNKKYLDKNRILILFFRFLYK